MSQTETKNEAPVITKDDSQLTEELRAEIKASTVQENFNRAKKAREDLRALLSQAELKDGSYDFSKVEGMTDAEAYQKAQNLQAVFLEINHINNRKLLSANLEQTSRADAVGAPAMQMFDGVEGGRAPRDVFERFKQLHNLDTDKLFDNHKHIAAKATIDDFLLAYSSNTPAVTGTNPRPTSNPVYPSNDGPATTAGQGFPTNTGGGTDFGTTASLTGHGVNRYLSEQIPAQRAYRKRDMLNPMIARIPCPPVTDTLRYIAEELATGAPGSSNRVAGRKEGERAPMQDMSTREIAVTVIKRMISATVTNEQLTDTIQARQIMNDNILMKIQEDFEDQVINGNGDANAGNMAGIFHRPTNPAQTTDLRSLDAADPHYKQLFSRTDGETRTVLDFYLDALTQYLKPRPDNESHTTDSDGRYGTGTPGSAYGAGRSPTHIVLGLAEKMRLMGQKDNQGRYLWANTVEGDFISLWGMPILISDYIPNEQGLILAVDELAVVVKAGVEWNFGLKDDDLVRDQTTMVAKHRANLLVKRPRTVMILDNLAA